LNLAPRLAKLAQILILALAPTLAPAQAPSAARATVTLNPIRDQSKPLNFGLLVQSGFGITEDRGSFRFFMAGVRAGKVLTANAGPGLLRGNFEYAVEVFPFWQSYTPTMPRQNCVYIQTTFGTETSCSAPFTIGGTYTGASITPIILRWNFAGSRRIAPWVQGAGGLLWTNHKYPAFGGKPINNGGFSTTSYGDNGPNDDTSVWNFTPQFGIGMHYFLSSDRSIDIGANAIHISSASLGDKNPGVNASAQFTLGYSWWK
jgi:lipid A 3-O-deacylase